MNFNTLTGLRLRSPLIVGQGRIVRGSVFPELDDNDDPNADGEHNGPELPPVNCKIWNGWRLSYRGEQPEHWRPTKFRMRLTRKRTALAHLKPDDVEVARRKNPAAIAAKARRSADRTAARRRTIKAAGSCIAVGAAAPIADEG